jgi:hypothetical protein
MIKITRPFDDVPLWQFENVIIPDLDYSRYEAKQVKNDNSILDLDVYSNRNKIYSNALDNCPDFKIIKDQVRNIVEDIEKSSNIDTLYCINPWDMNGYQIDIVIDNSKFFMGDHIDNRNIKCNLFLNLQDNKSSTEFSILNSHTPFNTEDFKPSNRQWKGPTNKGTGYFWFNTPELWHKINVKDEERKIAMMGVVIK